MSEELKKAAQEYIADIAIDYDLIVAERPDLHPLLAVAFEAGATWHKKQAFREIIKDIQKPGGIKAKDFTFPGGLTR
jgi:hypothetical protein